MPNARIEQGSFPPIAEYAFISDCEVGALVAPSGNVEWLCLPRFDSPSVFAPMLDRDAGRFRLGPADVQVPATRRYLPGSMVVETTWKTGTGWLVVRDALTIGPWHHQEERAHRQRRAPSDWEAEHVLLRTLRCAQGSVEVSLECEPRFDYGRLAPGWTYVGETYHEARASAPGDSLEIGLTSSLRIGFEGPRAAARTTLREGDTGYVALHWSEHPGPASSEEAYMRMNRTSAYWREWLAQGDFPDHPWRSFLERSALTLKGLSYAPTGAIVAAPTTSLPRVPGGDRNYDYRYSFKRDAGFTVWAAYTLGFDWEADDFFYFLADVADEGGATQNMFAITGNGHDLSERTVEELSGFGGARPVRIGNDAYRYEQHDVYGAIVDAAELHASTRDQLPERVWPTIRRQVEIAEGCWREPDRGIWATRGDPRHYTSSKVMCWAALERGSRLAARRGDLDLSEHWRAVAAEIQQDVLHNALDERGVFCAHYDTDELDASVLLMALVRFLPGTDHRLRKTVLTIAEELTSHGFVLRHQPDPDEPVEGETFLVCSLWLASALVRIDEVDRALAVCERVLASASPLQLYAEHLDPLTGRHLGNFPHAFTHLALVNALAHVIEAGGRLA